MFKLVMTPSFTINNKHNSHQICIELFSPISVIYINIKKKFQNTKTFVYS